jgi:hypothetical protein
MGGIAGSLDIVGKGMIRYKTLDLEGCIQVIKRAAKHIPGLPIRLIPPLVIFHDVSVGYCYISDGKLELRFANGKTIRVDINPITNLPILKVFADATKTATTLESFYYSCVTDETNQNISAVGKDLLQWKIRLGHISMDAVLALARNGFLGQHVKKQFDHMQPEKKGQSWDFPLCGTCQYAKQSRTPTNVQRTIVDDGHKLLSKDITQPGEHVSVDQFEVVKPGQRFQGFGRSSDKAQFTCGTIFVDNATGLIRVYYRPMTRSFLRSCLNRKHAYPE